MRMRQLKKQILCGAAALLLTSSSVSVFVSAEPRPDPSMQPTSVSKLDGTLIERGRYLAQTAGCNDCHTPGYALSAGKVDEAKWLTGDSIGWAGPWGTTYPINLRLFMNELTEQQWLAIARTPARPPMPWFALRDMSDDDLRAIYAFVRSLGPIGQPAPAYVPPGQTAQTPVVRFPAG